MEASIKIILSIKHGKAINLMTNSKSISNFFLSFFTYIYYNYNKKLEIYYSELTFFFLLEKKGEK